MIGASLLYTVNGHMLALSVLKEAALTQPMAYIANKFLKYIEKFWQYPAMPYA